VHSIACDCLPPAGQVLQEVIHGVESRPMPFNSAPEVTTRLANADQLTRQEIRDLIPWLGTITEAGNRRLNTELFLQNIEAVQRFESSSSKLTKWLLGLTIALVVLTGILIYFTVLLARKS
jgi:hypothetical protein